MKKDFKIARKPGQALATTNTTAVTAPASDEASPPAPKKKPSPTPEEPKKIELGASTRKTIEVPEEYFYQVKMRALQRRMLEKELWAEILAEYFSNHPTL